MSLDDNRKAHLLIYHDDNITVVVDNKPYILVQPPEFVVETQGGDSRLVKRLETGSAVMYTDGGVDFIIFDADVDDVVESMNCDILEQEKLDKLEMSKIDVAWFV